MIKVILAGAGDRGQIYANYIKNNPDKAVIVGVAEPRDFQRNLIKNMFNLNEEQCFYSWEGLADKEKHADAVIIATQDKMHTEPAIKFAEKKYHILLEKPMAPSEEECRRIVQACKDNKVILSVCHVLRYTPFTKKLKEVLNTGIIGKIVSMQRLEPVGYWHQAHSFVRGNWRNEEESSFMLLAKSCHDLDWINYIMPSKCSKVASFGSLYHFKKSEKPAGAADKCTMCPENIEKDCPYSAKKIYLGFFDKGVKGWPLSILTDDISYDGVYKALEEGPYGRCVYECDNDVVDNQVVAMSFDDGSTVNFTMTAFNEYTARRTTIFGTHGEIRGDGRYIKIINFRDNSVKKIDSQEGIDKLSGHGGGDSGIMENFIEAVSSGDSSKILTGADETLMSHLMVFRSEKSRKNGTVEEVRI
ncbi:MAG: Gfo/Idh/MocA family oxidoreductase [Candidatus Delongbacteria bacterium]|nr:Gfo/Idh/MocA family oxidoreductase [Candidatus Delongbacteria bacterium]MBN2835978.1 Gfo/Idh/MocA family oxidoreductase [Candidatus Delongbacteria bacterium]